MEPLIYRHGMSNNVSTICSTFCSIICSTIFSTMFPTTKESGFNFDPQRWGWTHNYCPSLRLKEQDFVMPRKNFPVWELICKDPLLIKAEIHEWSNGEELERISLRLINKICSGESAEFIASNCKLHIMCVFGSD